MPEKKPRGEVLYLPGDAAHRKSIGMLHWRLFCRAICKISLLGKIGTVRIFLHCFRATRLRSCSQPDATTNGVVRIPEFLGMEAVISSLAKCDSPKV
jgi:hypothetical protein